jgi:hypothetical protein
VVADLEDGDAAERAGGHGVGSLPFARAIRTGRASKPDAAAIRVAVRVVRIPQFVMRRPLATIVAVLAVLLQLALGVSASLGLVLCVGDDHAGIELAGDGCCASHGTLGPTAVTTLERACCSDVPLYWAVRPLSDLRRVSPSLAPIASLVPFLTIGPASAALLSMPAHGEIPPPTVHVRRSVVLRV